MFRLKQRMDDFLHTASILIENSIAIPEIAKALANHGYPEDKLKGGKYLYNEAAALHLAQMRASGARITATAEFKSLWAEAKRQYMRALKTARVALKDTVKAEQGIMLNGDREQSFSGWMEQARTFYANMLNDSQLLEIMTGFGYPLEKLQEESALIERVAEANLRQKKAMGAALEATQTRDQKFNELATWVSDLKAIAKVAFDDDPEQLEKLGIVAREK